MSQLERPEITVANWEEIERYTLAFEPNPRIAKFVFGAVGRVFKPTVHYQPGARPKISEQLRTPNTTVALAPNHSSFFDPLDLAGWLWNDPLFADCLYDAAIPSKLELFTMLNGLLRVPIEHVGAYPAIRPNDGKNLDSELLSDGIDSTRRLNQEMLFRHKLFGVYMQITRVETDDQTKVEGSTKVLGNAIVAIRDRRKVKSVPVGTFFTEGVDVNKPSIAVTRPTMCVGKPIDCDSKDPAEITGLVEEGIKENVLWASELHLAA